MATSVDEDHALPNVQGTQQTTHPSWWVVGDMFHFENIGFLRVGPGTSGVRYLACADCEYEPIGFGGPNNKFYIAKDMVTLRN